MIQIAVAKMALAFIGGAVVGRILPLSLAYFYKSNEGTKSGRQGKRERTWQEETAEDWSRESQPEKQRSRTNAEPSKKPSSQETKLIWQGDSEVSGQEETAAYWSRESHLERITSKLNSELSKGTKLGCEGKTELVGQGETAGPSKVPSHQEHYAVLGLDPPRSHSYTDAEIKAAVRAKALKLHFDTFKTSKPAEKKFHKVMEAYDALKGSN